MMPSKITRYIQQKRWTLLSIGIIIPLGFYSKFYAGPAEVWVNNSLGGILYVIFWSLFASLFFARIRVWKIAAIILVVTCLLEFLQLWHPPFLEVIRSTFIGVTLIGNLFSWLDLVHYVIGFFLSFTLLNVLRKT